MFGAESEKKSTMPAPTLSILLLVQSHEVTRCGVVLVGDRKERHFAAKGAPAPALVSASFESPTPGRQDILAAVDHSHRLLQARVFEIFPDLLKLWMTMVVVVVVFVVLYSDLVNGAVYLEAEESLT